MGMLRLPTLSPGLRRLCCRTCLAAPRGVNALPVHRETQQPWHVGLGSAFVSWTLQGSVIRDGVMFVLLLNDRLPAWTGRCGCLAQGTGLAACLCTSLVWDVRGTGAPDPATEGCWDPWCSLLDTRALLPGKGVLPSPCGIKTEVLSSAISCEHILGGKCKHLNVSDFWFPSEIEARTVSQQKRLFPCCFGECCCIALLQILTLQQ